MKIKRLKLKNIRSYDDGEINFPEGSVLLSGEVGSGKTSILLAIEYAIFGLQPGQKGSSLLRNNTVEGEVILEMEVDGVNIILERKLRRGAKSVTNEYAAITIEGNKIESSITEIKIKILQLLGYPAEFIKKNNLLYRYTVYTPQEQMKQIVLEDPEVRLNIIRHIFGIDKYKHIRENLLIILNNLKEESKELQGEIKSLDQNKISLESIKSFVSMLDLKIKEKDLELDDDIKNRKRIEAGIIELENKIKEKEHFEKEVEKTRMLTSLKSQTLSSLINEINDLSKSVNEIKDEYDNKVYEETLHLIKENRSELEILNKKYIETISKINSQEHRKQDSMIRKERVFKIDVCPTCLQNVPHVHKHNILNETEKEIVESNSILSNLNKDRIDIDKNISKTKNNLELLEEKRLNLDVLRSKLGYIQKAKTKLDESLKQRESLEKDLVLLDKHSDGLKAEILRFSKFNNLFKIQQDELKKAFLKEKNSEIALAELKKELELTHREINNLEKSILSQEECKTRLLYLLELSDWLSNQFLALVDYTERNLLMKLRIEFSKLFNKWFNILTRNSFNVQLDENFTPLIMQGDNEMEYSFLSGGERTAIALAYRLALNQTINSVLSQIKTRDIVILDEPTEGFSSEQLDKMRDILEELKVKQLMIVSHEQKIESFVENIIKIKKEEDKSVIDLEASSTEFQTQLSD